MAVSYDKLFVLLRNKGMSNSQLAKEAGISLNIITRLKRKEYISLESIEKICHACDCGMEDIIEFISNGDGEKSV